MFHAAAIVSKQYHRKDFKVSKNPMSTPLVGHYHKNEPTPSPRKGAMIASLFLMAHYCHYVFWTLLRILACFFTFQASFPGELVSVIFLIVSSFVWGVFLPKFFFHFGVISDRKRSAKFAFSWPPFYASPSVLARSWWVLFSHILALTERCDRTVAIV